MRHISIFKGISFAVIAGLSLAACLPSTPPEGNPKETRMYPDKFPLTVSSSVEQWTIDLRKWIIHEVKQVTPDSSHKNQAEQYIRHSYYYQGQELMAFAMYKATGDTIYFSYHSPTTGFIANGENCRGEHIGHKYRGLKLGHEHMGLATYYRCKTGVFETGFFHQSQKVGTWKTFYPEGKVEEENHPKREKQWQALQAFAQQKFY